MEPNSREFYKQCAFQKFCNTVLHNEACDTHRELRRHKAKEVTFSDMTLDEARQLHTFDEYFKREAAETVFEKAGKKITPKLLLEAIRTLPEEKRKAILLYYFEGMNDTEIQSDGNQYQIVHDMMMDSLKIHTATYIADTYPDFKKRINGADRKSDGCRIRSSYAVGFTKDAGDNSKVVMRKENIRNAFNSPMRPFVLATTSIGQEGLDFHNYCRVIMHWNLPSNPIDVGRILRTFKIKKNVEVTDNGKIII